MNNNNDDHGVNYEHYFRNLQLLIAKLIRDIEQKALASNKDARLLLQQSQRRLLNYKELLIHLPHIDESELLFARTELSMNEKQIAKQGEQALTLAIDALDKSLSISI